MALTESNMLPLGAALPDFSLPDSRTGKTVANTDYAGTPVMVVFMCNHCPFVVHLLDGLAAAARDFQAQGVSVLAISSNDVSTHPADSPERMAELAQEHGFDFPYAFDESQAIARAFDAACTPDFYLFDSCGKLVYRGQFDGARPGNAVFVTGEDLRAAVDALVAGATISSSQKPSIGCSIKWRAVG